MAKAASKKKTKLKSKSKSKTLSRSRTKLPKRKATKAKKSAAKKAVKKVAKKTVTKKASIRKIASIRSVAAPSMASAAPEVVRLSEGQMAPDFNLINQAGETVTLSSFLGRNVVLYFYPKDDTPGCTKEACSFRDNIGSIDGLNATLLGVSFDDQASHRKFIEKYGLNFQLLSDPTKEVAQAYGVYVEKNMYGNISWGIERSTFIINREGRVAKVWRRVSVDGHTEQVLEALRALS